VTAARQQAQQEQQQQRQQLQQRAAVAATNSQQQQSAPTTQAQAGAGTGRSPVKRPTPYVLAEPLAAGTSPLLQQH
jgi:hypothetical protein